MTFVTSEIWRILQLAANGCSSHVTTSECTTDGRGRTDGRTAGRGREERRPRRQRRKRVTLHLRNTNSSDGDGGGREMGIRRERGVRKGPTTNGVSVSRPWRGSPFPSLPFPAICDSRSVRSRSLFRLKGRSKPEAASLCDVSDREVSK